MLLCLSGENALAGVSFSILTAVVFGYHFFAYTHFRALYLVSYIAECTVDRFCFPPYLVGPSGSPVYDMVGIDKTVQVIRMIALRATGCLYVWHALMIFG